MSKRKWAPNILSCDPGSKNWAWVYMPGTSILGEATETGMMPEMRGFTAAEIEAWQAMFLHMLWPLKDKLDMFVFERYHTRGKGSQNNEVINILIGIIISETGRLGIKLGELLRPTDWKSYYKHRNIDWHKTVCQGGKTEHIRDAHGLGLWYRNKYHDPTLIQRRLTWRMDKLHLDMVPGSSVGAGGVVTRADEGFLSAKRDVAQGEHLGRLLPGSPLGFGLNVEGGEKPNTEIRDLDVFATRGLKAGEPITVPSGVWG